jgi:hypothetical protein
MFTGYETPGVCAAKAWDRLPFDRRCKSGLSHFYGIERKQNVRPHSRGSGNEGIAEPACLQAEIRREGNVIPR